MKERFCIEVRGTNRTPVIVRCAERLELQVPLNVRMKKICLKCRLETNMWVESALYRVVRVGKHNIFYIVVLHLPFWVHQTFLRTITFFHNDVEIKTKTKWI